MKKLALVLLLIVVGLEINLAFRSHSPKSELTARPDEEKQSAEMASTRGIAPAIQKVSFPKSTESSHQTTPQAASQPESSPKGEDSEALLFLLQHSNCKNDFHELKSKCEEAFSRLNSDPERGAQLLKNALQVLPEKSLREREEILGLIQDLNLSSEERSQFYLGQSLKPLPSSQPLEAELERKTAFDYFLGQTQISLPQKESALLEALEIHQSSPRLQRQLLMLFARLDEERSRGLFRKYNLDF